MIMKKKDRLINIRFLFCVFVGLIIGILIGKLFLTQVLSIWGVLISLVLLAGVSILCFFYGKKTEEYNSKLKYRKNLSAIIKYSSMGFLVAIFVGIIIIAMPILKICTIKEYSGQVIVSGVVSEYVNSEETYKKFVLTDCSAIDTSGKSELGCDIIIYTNSQSNIHLGDRVVFTGNLSRFLVSDGYGLNSLINGIGYSAFVNTSDMVVSDNNISIKDWVRSSVYNLLKDNLNADNADICYAILFGQKESLDEGVSRMFSYAGISHILAVSGLHVSVLVSIIWFVLNKLKCNKYVKLGVFSAILLFYSYLCSFSPSVCRAGIMAFVLALCKMERVEYDSLSSLSLSGIIILLISPEKLFSLSFQLSFMCIFSIIAFSPCIEFLLSKIKCPKWLSSVLAISIAINIATLPILINTFGEVSLLGIVSNILVLPIFSIVYVLLFTVTLLGVIIKPLGALLVLPELFLHLIRVIAEYVSSIPIGIYRVLNVSYWLIALMILLSLVIHFLMTKHYLKIVAVAMLTVIIGVIFGINTIPAKYSNDIIVETQYRSGVTMLADESTTAMFGSDITRNTLLSMCKKMRIKDIDEIYAFDLQLNEINELIEICHDFGVKRVYIPSRFDYEDVREKLPNTEILESGKKVCGYTLNVINYSDGIVAIKLTSDRYNILIPNLDNNKQANLWVKDFCLSDIDYLFVENDGVWADMGGVMAYIHYFDEKGLIIKGE